MCQLEFVNVSQDKTVLSECFFNLCFNDMKLMHNHQHNSSKSKLFWNDNVHCGIKHNDHHLKFSDVNSYVVDVFLDFSKKLL